MDAGPHDPATSFALPRQTPDTAPNIVAAPSLTEATIRRIIRSELAQATKSSPDTPLAAAALATPGPKTSPEELARLQRDLDQAIRDITLDGRINAQNTHAFENVLARLPPDKQTEALGKLNRSLNATGTIQP